MAAQGRKNLDYRVIQGIADQAKSEFRDTFLAAVRQVVDDTSYAAIKDAVEVGNWQQIEELIPFNELAEELMNLVPVYEKIINSAGAKAAESIPGEAALAFTFNIRNLLVQDWIIERTGFMITEVTRETREAVKGVISRAFAEGMAPRESARHIRNMVGLTVKQAQAADNFRRSLQKANTTPAVVERKVTAYKNRLLTQRATNIARTETLAASNGGAMQSYKLAARQGYLNTAEVQKTWILTPDDRLCPYCQEMRGNTVDIDDSFISMTYGAIDAPPLHPQCRCTIGLVKKQTR